MIEQIQIRRDTAANWTSANPTLAQGEPALETDTGFQKMGDGVTAWNSLAYALSKAGLASTTSATLGQGLVGFNPALTYAAGTLPAALASTASGQGAALVGVKAGYANSAARNQYQKNSDRISLTDWPGIDLTGATDCTAAIQVAVNDATGTVNGYWNGANVNNPATAVMPVPVRFKVPIGTLRIDGTVFCPVGCSFDFDGTLINLLNNTTTAAFSYNPGYTGSPIFVCEHTTFRGCQVIGNYNTFNTKTYLWSINRMPFFNAEDVTCFYTQIANIVGESILTRFFHVSNYRPVGIGWNLSLGSGTFGPNFCTCVSCYCEEGMYCNTVNAGSFISGNVHTILAPGSTNFTAIGAPSNAVGTVFVATGAGAGTGTAMTGVTGFVLSSGSMQVMDSYMEAIKDFVLLSGGADFTFGSGCSLNMRNSVNWTNQSNIVSNLIAINTTGAVQSIVRLTDCTVSLTGNSIGGSGNSNFVFPVYTGGSGPNIQMSNVQVVCGAPANTSEVTVFKLGANVTVTGAVGNCQFTVPLSNAYNTPRLNLMDTSSNAGSVMNVVFTGNTIWGANSGLTNPDSISFELNGATTGTGFFNGTFTGNTCLRLTNITKGFNAIFSNNTFTNGQGLIFTDQATVANRCLIQGNTFLSNAPVFTNPGLIVNNQGIAAGTVIPAAGTITPGAQTIGVSGSGVIQTITLGAWPTITLLPQTGATWTLGVSGNITFPSTAVVGKALTLTWSTANNYWWPSY